MSAQTGPGMDIVIGARTTAALEQIGRTKQAVQTTAAELRAAGKAATEGLGKDVRAGVDAAAAAATRLRQEIGSTTVVAGTAFRSMVDPVRGVGAALKGVQQASGAAFGALNLIGEKVAPQLASVTNALAGLVAGGFTPLGIAISVATAGIGLLATKMDDTLSPAAKAAQDRLTDLRKELAEIKIEIAAAQAGRPVGRQRWVEREGELLESGRKVQTAIDSLRAQIAERRAELGEGGLSAEAIGGLKSEIAFLEDQVKARGRIARQIQDEYSLLREIALEDERRTDTLSRQNELLAVRKRQLEDWQTTVDPYDDLMPPIAGVLAEEREREARIRRGLENVRRRQYEDWQTTVDPYDDLMPDERGVEAEVREREAQIRRQLEAVARRQVDGTESSLGDELEEMTAEIKAVKRELTEVEQLGLDVGESLADGFTSAFESAASGAKDLADVLSDVGDSIMSMLLQFAARGLGGAALSQLGVGGQTIRDIGFIAPRAAAAGAAGGSWLVGGSGATDSKYVGMQLSPGELVEVTPPGGRGGPEVAVTVINTTGQPARQERRRGSDGREEIRVLVGQAVAEDIATGGPAARALERHYGARRDPVRRG